MSPEPVSNWWQAVTLTNRLNRDTKLNEYLKWILWIDGEKSFTLAPGRYQLGFSLELPAVLAPSFEAKHGSISYKVQVTINRTWKLTGKSSRPFYVLRVADNTPPLFDMVMTSALKFHWENNWFIRFTDSGREQLNQNARFFAQWLRSDNGSSLCFTSQISSGWGYHRLCRHPQSNWQVDQKFQNSLRSGIVNLEWLWFSFF